MNKKFIKKTRDHYESFSTGKWFHAKRVCAYAIKFSRKLKLNEKDLEIIKIAALIHDIGYSKVIGRNHNTGKEKIIGKDNHATYGAEMCEDFLKELELDKYAVEKIKEAITSHDNFNECKTLFQKIIYDADKLDKTSIGEVIRKSLIMNRRGLDEEHMFHRLKEKMNKGKFHFEESKEIAKENLSRINPSFDRYAEFLDFCNKEIKE